MTRRSWTKGPWLAPRPRPRSRLWGAVGSALAVLPSPAAAAIGPIESWAAGDWLMAGVAAAPLLIAAGLWRKLQSNRRQAAELQAALLRREDVLAVAPGGWCGWRSSGGWSASPGLSASLGLDAPPIDFDRVLARFDEADRPALGQAVERLRRDGQPFTLVARLGPRTFDVSGRQPPQRVTPAGDSMSAVVWFAEATAREQATVRANTAQAAADARAKLFTDIFDVIGMPVWLRQADGRIIACNAAYARAVEATSPILAIDEQRELAGARYDWSRALASRAATSNTAQSGDLHVVVDGARQLFMVTETPIGDDFLAGFAINRTEVEETQAELSRHMAAHRDVLEKLGTGIVIYGPDTRVRFFNSAFARLWGLEEDWLATLPTHGEILEELRARRRLPEQADFQAYKKQRLSFYTSLIEPLEELLYLPDERVLRTVINPHPQGGLLYTIEDVTDRLTLERSYNTLIAVQRETLDNLHAAVAVFGSDGKLKLYNQAFARIWNFQSTLLSVEPHVSDLVDAAQGVFRYAGDWETYRDYVVSRATDHVARSGVFLRSDGSVLDYNSVPLPDGAMMFSYLDVTDSYNVERALRERNEALETADRLKSEFITNVSYELRTPLNTIIGFTEILANQYFGTLNDRQVEYSRGILESSRQLLALIDDILDLALIEAGRLSLDLKPTQIHDVLFSVASLARDRARKQNITLSFECAPDVGMVMADERRLRQALFNLVSNAIKYTGNQGRVVLRAVREAGEVVLSVSDTGPGISPEDQSRVFEKFERGGHNGGGRVPGLGIGLSLVKSFIELHGGRIELQSEPGKGTVVTCRLPSQASEVLREAGE